MTKNTGLLKKQTWSQITKKKRKKKQIELLETKNCNTKM